MHKALDEKLDLLKLNIVPFSTECVVNRFECGQVALDRFLKNKAKKSCARGECKVFCAQIGNNPQVIGYYSLQVGSDSVDELPSSGQTYLKNYTAFPAIHLSHLAVDERYQNQNLGSYLIMDVLSKVQNIAKYVGFYCLTLQSIDEESTAFYERLNFTIYSENEQQPKMLFPREAIMELNY